MAFAIPFQKISQADYLLLSELLHSYITFLDVPGNDKNVMQTRLWDRGLMPYSNSGKINNRNMSKPEYIALNNF